MDNSKDPRHIVHGHKIPCEEYCDQPFVVQTDDGAWLCIMTTARGHEGTTSQHIVSTRSKDQGRTWSPLVDVEPPGPPEASYATTLKVLSGRVYAFYNHNTDNLREVKSDNGIERRVDTLGHFVFKYSDDGGRSWSAQRFEIPVREFQIDRENPYGGKVRFFWHVGKPVVHNGAALVPLHKVGRFGEGFMARSEGVFLRSDNILAERDPQKIRWETLPDGDIGLRAPRGPIADEQNLTSLSDGSLYCTYRTVDGHPCHAYSRDGGRTWTPPAYMTDANGRSIKHPRAANFVRRFSNGKYLYWFHNHGGKWYDGRNPVWLCGGEEADSTQGKVILWSQPEIALYDDDIGVRMSYPDFIEDGAKYFVTETQKTIARVHELDSKMLQGLWNQRQGKQVARDGIVVELGAAALRSGATVAMPPLPRIWKQRGGFALDFWVRFDALDTHQVLWDTRDQGEQGILLWASERGTLAISLSGKLGMKGIRTDVGLAESVWHSDAGRLEPGHWHHVAVSVDGGPKIVTWVIDGILCNGGSTRSQGWGRMHPYLDDVNGAKSATIAHTLRGQINRLRLYQRYLRTSEAIANFRAEEEQMKGKA